MMAKFGMVPNLSIGQGALPLAVQSGLSTVNVQSKNPLGSIMQLVTKLPNQTHEVMHGYAPEPGVDEAGPGVWAAEGVGVCDPGPEDGVGAMGAGGVAVNSDGGDPGAVGDGGLDPGLVVGAVAGGLAVGVAEEGGDDVGEGDTGVTAGEGVTAKEGGDDVGEGDTGWEQRKV
ncbi:hypothetical protein GH714_038165 [Hevea brasiliensis]|uniref:Uncharacterized protein n=1 Tax=Hevea brasiliensis TaxID=3981 RepID=A0A6A6MSE0_HEVBR|nr:hypothetical protein GH714_038165 [Hevea brasiliensis]